MTVRAFLPTDAWVRWLLVPAVAFIALASNTAYLADFWHHLARGREIVATGQLLDHDIFTCTVPGQPFQDVNWLSQVVYYQLYELGGLGLVRVVNALFVAGSLLWLIGICRRSSGSLAVAVGIGIGTFLGLWDILTIRPQTFSLLLFVMMVDVLERSAQRPGLLLAPPLLMALWPNLHGAFPAGIMLLGCWWLAAAWTAWRRREPAAWRWLWLLTACGAASALATLANPYGWGVYLYAGQTSSLAAARGIDEWLPPALGQRIGLAFFASLPLLVGLLLFAWRKRGAALLSARELFLILCFLPLACGSVRMVAWWLLVVAPIGAMRVALLWPNLADPTIYRPNRGAAVCVGALAMMMVLSVPGLQHWNPLLRLREVDATTTHLHEVQALLVRHSETSGAAAGSGGYEPCRIFTRFEWGEYLSWAGHPRLRVFMDGRIEIFPDDVWQDYAAVTCGAVNWAHVLDDYRIDALVLDVEYHRRTGLLGQVEQAPNWQLIHQAGQTQVFVRGR